MLINRKNQGDLTNISAKKNVNGSNTDLDFDREELHVSVGSHEGRYLLQVLVSGAHHV